MKTAEYDRRSSSLLEVAGRISSPEVAALLRQYAREFAIRAKAERRERRLQRLARAGRTLRLDS